jgi:predicted dehydrogenase
VKIAVIGAGMALGPYLPCFRALAGRIAVAWVVGRTPDRAGAAAAQCRGAVASTSLDDVLGDAGVAAAFVLTPPNTHLDIVSRLAAAGKHVLLEKPLELDSVRAEALVSVCREAGVRLGVMLQHRLRPASVAMKTWWHPAPWAK